MCCTEAGAVGAQEKDVAAMTDPITELVECLTRGEVPPLAWVVRWCDRDSIARAWRESCDGRAMARVLGQCTVSGFAVTDAAWEAERMERYIEEEACESLRLVAHGVSVIGTGENDRGAELIKQADVRARTVSLVRQGTDRMWRYAVYGLREKTPPTLTELLVRYRIR
jgi:hypothetical protein